ncbi:MAG: adenylate/guanylate cyclase domain-containing protein [Planctomycetes bacterium]|nr:adenylate/guanylate cyclase domain-containing protein [Planctomycetota bacterium]MCA9563665.1 adenylate/guanylate cyclase domain-containing protein [Myxococcales bacterium]
MAARKVEPAKSPDDGIPQWIHDWFDDGDLQPFYDWLNGADSGWISDLPGWQGVGDFSDIEPDFTDARRDEFVVTVPGRVSLYFEDAKGDEDGMGGLGSGTCDFEAEFDLDSKEVRVTVFPVDLDDLLQPDWPVPDIDVPLHCVARRVVAAFIDIRGFTSWLNQTPDRNANTPELMLEFWRVVISSTPEDPCRVIRKPLGDGCMFLWLPDEGEEGLVEAIQQAVSSLISVMEEWKVAADGFNFAPPTGIGAAIATGEVLSLKQREHGSAGEDFYDVVGVPLNLAARICNHAKPGQILTSADVPKQLREPQGFVFNAWSSVDEAQAKGFTKGALDGVCEVVAS